MERALRGGAVPSACTAASARGRPFCGSASEGKAEDKTSIQTISLLMSHYHLGIVDRPKLKLCSQ